MEVLKFIPWLWKKYDDGEKVLIVLVAFVAILFPSMYVWGIAALIVVGIIVLVGFALFLVTMVVLSVIDRWHEYKYEKAQEAERIVNRLKGKGTYF